MIFSKPSFVVKTIMIGIIILFVLLFLISTFLIHAMSIFIISASEMRMPEDQLIEEDGNIIKTGMEQKFRECLVNTQSKVLWAMTLIITGDLVLGIIPIILIYIKDVEEYEADNELNNSKSTNETKFPRKVTTDRAL